LWQVRQNAIAGKFDTKNLHPELQRVLPKTLTKDQLSHLVVALTDAVQDIDQYQAGRGDLSLDKDLPAFDAMNVAHQVDRMDRALKHNADLHKYFGEMEAVGGRNGETSWYAKEIGLGAFEEFLKWAYSDHSDKKKGATVGYIGLPGQSRAAL